MKPVFVKIRNDDNVLYHSYVDYWELVSLSGFDTCELGEIDYQSDDVYIISPDNGNVSETLLSEKALDRKCTIVWYTLEFPEWKEGKFVNRMKNYFDEFWCPDIYLAELYGEIRPGDVKYVFLGGHDKFGGEPAKNKIWDFCTLSYDYGVRLHKVNILKERGYTFSPPGWGDVRRRSLAYSKWGLALQQFNIPFLSSPQRWTLFSSWKLPILCDYVRDPHPYKCFPEGLVHFDPRNSICGDEKIMAGAVEYNYNYVKEHTFYKSIMEAI